MGAKKTAAVISQCGSTGINLHDKPRTENKTQRVQVCVQCSWTAETMLQQFGRTNRVDQRTSPKFVLMITDVKGEMRFYSSFLERLQKLVAQRFKNFIEYVQLKKAILIVFTILQGAMTQGDRRAVSLRFDVDCPISDNNVIASKAGLLTVKELQKKSNIASEMRKTGLLDQEGPTKYAKSIESFLNRMLGCSIETQEILHRELTKYYRYLTIKAKNNGEYDEGIQGMLTRLNKYKYIRCVHKSLTQMVVMFLGISRRWKLTWKSETGFTDNGEDGPMLTYLQVDRGLHWYTLITRVFVRFEHQSPIFFQRKYEILCGFPVETIGIDLSGAEKAMIYNYKTFSPLNEVEVENFFSSSFVSK